MHVMTAAEGRLRAAASDAWGADIGASALASVSVAEGRKTKMFSTFRRRWVRLGQPAANISFFKYSFNEIYFATSMNETGSTVILHVCS